MTASDLRALVDYNYWARDRILDAVAAVTPEQYTRAMGNSFSSVRDTLVHIYSAEWVWLSRWRGISPSAPIAADAWPELGPLVAAWRDVEAGVRAFLDGAGEDGLARVIEYKLISGQPGRSTFGHMLQHVVNHGTYHRGQITTLLRQLGAAPPKSTDLIAFYRERQV
jgi:uncharacterized damage-inducible protein DinB